MWESKWAPSPDKADRRVRLPEPTLRLDTLPGLSGRRITSANAALTQGRIFRGFVLLQERPPRKRPREAAVSDRIRVSPAGAGTPEEETANA